MWFYSADDAREYRRREAYLFRQYGITMDEYSRMLENQGGGCARCRKTPEENGRVLAVDHNHACCPGRWACGGCVRGLLCDQCNRMLGVIEAYLRDPDWWNDYLKG